MNKPTTLTDMLRQVERTFKQQFEVPQGCCEGDSAANEVGPDYYPQFSEPPTYWGAVSDADMERTRALMPELMNELRQRLTNPPPVQDSGEWDYDGDGGREHSDNDEKR
jgi:hypothetical protein